MLVEALASTDVSFPEEASISVGEAADSGKDTAGFSGASVLDDVFTGVDVGVFGVTVIWLLAVSGGGVMACQTSTPRDARHSATMMIGTKIDVFMETLYHAQIKEITRNVHESVMSLFGRPHLQFPQQSVQASPPLSLSQQDHRGGVRDEQETHASGRDS